MPAQDEVLLSGGVHWFQPLREGAPALLSRETQPQPYTLQLPEYNYLMGSLRENAAEKPDHGIALWKQDSSATVRDSPGTDLVLRECMSLEVSRA
jgi:hypothetical protein